MVVVLQIKNRPILLPVAHACSISTLLVCMHFTPSTATSAVAKPWRHLHVKDPSVLLQFASFEQVCKGGYLSVALKLCAGLKKEAADMTTSSMVRF